MRRDKLITGELYRHIKYPYPVKLLSSDLYSYTWQQGTPARYQSAASAVRSAQTGPGGTYGYLVLTGLPYDKVHPGQVPDYPRYARHVYDLLRQDTPTVKELLDLTGQLRPRVLPAGLHLRMITSLRQVEGTWDDVQRAQAARAVVNAAVTESARARAQDLLNLLNTALSPQTAVSRFQQSGSRVRFILTEQQLRTLLLRAGLSCGPDPASPQTSADAAGKDP